MLTQKLLRILSNSFIQNLGWMSAAELVNRVLRLGVVVVLARVLSAYDYGLVAVVLTTSEFAGVFMLKQGIGAKLIQADDQDIGVLRETAYWMNWILCLGLFMIQGALAFPIGWFYGDTQVALPICAMAASYLLMPLFSVQLSLIQRENRLDVIARCQFVQAIAGNSLTVIFALMGMGMWAIVLPTILMIPVWMGFGLMNHLWRPKRRFTLYRWRDIASFATDMLGVELLSKLRANLDYLLVGRFLGLEMLGIYYFAFNAGLGFSLNLINALNGSLFPHLCEVREDIEQLASRYTHGLKTVAKLIIPFVLIQTSLAPIYIPIIYGQQWISAVPILMLICFSAIPRAFGEAASSLLQAVDQTRINLYWNLGFTILFTLVLLLAVQRGIVGVAIAVLAVHLAVLPVFTLWAKRHVFQLALAAEVDAL
jgi:O-antigen/teichoic acid export membrane protein